LKVGYYSLFQLANALSAIVLPQLINFYAIKTVNLLDFTIIVIMGMFIAIAMAMFMTEVLSF